MAQRKIIHVDMDAFYASVEQRDRPELRGRPVVVGGSPASRGVVCAASYEARAYGIRSAIPTSRAARLCPQAEFLHPDFPRYRAVSQQIHAIFRRYTPCIEPLALDEAYLDVTTNHIGEVSATRIAERIRSAIRDEVNLTASAGVGPNKLVAKIASDANKPDGLCVVPPHAVSDFLAPLPVRAIPGIGPKSAERCKDCGILTVTDLRQASPETLQGCFGNHAEHFHNLAWGRDQRPVQANRERKSVGIEDTFREDLTTHNQAITALERLGEGLGTRIARAGVRGRTVTLKVKYHDFRQITRSSSRSDPTDDPQRITAIAKDLVAMTDIGQVPIRLLGISLSHLDDSGAIQERLDLS